MEKHPISLNIGFLLGAAAKICALKRDPRVILIVWWNLNPDDGKISKKLLYLSDVEFQGGFDGATLQDELDL